MSHEKENKVVSIGHNSGSTVSKEAYAKLLNSLHRLHIYSRQEMRRAERFLDEAFTKYSNSDPRSIKLKDFQIHESRSRGKEIADKFSEYAEENISTLESKANREDIKLDIDIRGHSTNTSDGENNS